MFQTRFRENQNTHFMFNNSFSSEHRAVDEMWKNAVVPDRPRARIALKVVMENDRDFMEETHTQLTP
jgi:hypothetical protein